MTKVFVSGCFDLMHSGHVAFFETAARYGDLYVGIGSDKTVLELKHRPTICPEAERLYLVSAIKYVKKAFISSGSGYLDFLPELEQIKPDIFIVNEDGASQDKADLCRRKGIKYIVLPRRPKEKLPCRSTTALREHLENNTFKA